ncbi:MAG: hypothetical protein II875_11975, partial [Clostridia bacterium]|nr:hypothetical protein [Clostridia bacterium]
ICRHSAKRIGRKHRIKAPTTRLRRSGGLKAAMGRGGYAAITHYAAQVRIRNVLWRQVAAATKKREAVALKRIFLRLRNAHGGVDAAATAKAQSRAPYWIMLLYATLHGGRLPPLRKNAMLLP